MTVLMFYFLFYARLAHHRGISHTPIVGTLTRVIYLGPILIILWWFGFPFQLWMLWVVLGLVLSDAVHFVHDAL